MDDNVRPHRVRLVTEFLAIERIVCPANSPDVKSVGNTVLWLTQLLLEEWMAIPQPRVSRLVNTTRRRYLDVIEKRINH